MIEKWQGRAKPKESEHQFKTALRTCAHDVQACSLYVTVLWKVCGKGVLFSFQFSSNIWSPFVWDHRIHTVLLLALKSENTPSAYRGAPRGLASLLAAATWYFLLGVPCHKAPSVPDGIQVEVGKGLAVSSQRGLCLRSKTRVQFECIPSEWHSPSQNFLGSFRKTFPWD